MKDWKKAYRQAFIAHLRTLIEESGKSIPKLAGDGDAESKTVYRVLNDENEPQITTILYIAKGLNLHPKELYDFDFPLDKLDLKTGEK